MIAFFPSPYPDELVYSLLARYYAKSGYVAYRYAAEDLYANKTVRPDIEFLNEFTDEALMRITQSLPMKSIVEKYTMFPYYGRFLPMERRNQAFQALAAMQGNYRNLLAIPKRKTYRNRYLCYCPLCVAEDRRRYGETFWHRVHQMQGITICPLHGCYLKESDLIISGKVSPMLVTAEESIPKADDITMCENMVEYQLAKYISAVFQSDVDMKSEVLVGDFLHCRMSGTKYRSTRGEQRNISLFHADFMDFYKTLPGNWFTELWQIQKVLTNDRVNIVEICMMAIFLDISVADLVNMVLPEKTQEQLFDEKIYQLQKQGLKYPQIAERLSASINTVKAIGEKRYGTYHKQPKKPLKSGAKPKDWKQMDVELLPEVRKAINQLQGDGISRPKRITVFAIEQILDLRPKQIDNLPLCRAEIKKHYMSQQQYWALEIVWAANTVIREGQPFNWKHIRELTNMRKRDLVACLPYVPKFTNKEMYEKIVTLQ